MRRLAESKARTPGERFEKLGKGETKMKKDIKWFKGQLEAFREETMHMWKQCKPGSREWWGFDGVLGAIGMALDLLDELEEPEVLSQDWIDEHKYFPEEKKGEDAVVKARDLRNLLVPKQELPVIPKHVADFIEETKKQNRSMVFAITHIYDKNEIGESPTREENIIFQWMELGDNEEVFARAWLDGYEVEEEPLYTARLKVIAGNGIESYLRTQSSNTEDRLEMLEIYSKYIHEDYRPLSEFTEHELKVLDIWDNDQWVVEEVEESEGGAPEEVDFF